MQVLSPVSLRSGRQPFMGVISENSMLLPCLRLRPRAWWVQGPMPHTPRPISHPGFGLCPYFWDVGSTGPPENVSAQSVQPQEGKVRKADRQETREPHLQCLPLHLPWAGTFSSLRSQIKASLATLPPLAPPHPLSSPLSFLTQLCPQSGTRRVFACLPVDCLSWGTVRAGTWSVCFTSATTPHLTASPPPV